MDASITFKERTERQLAREQQKKRLQSLQKLHLRIAADLLSEEPGAIAALDGARSMVELWAREKVCSAFYIDAWRILLAGSAQEVGAALTRMDKNWESAFLQNTPFGPMLRSMNADRSSTT